MPDDLQFYVSRTEAACRRMKELTPDEIAKRDRLSINAKPQVFFEDKNLKLRLGPAGVIILETKRPCLWSALKPRVDHLINNKFMQEEPQGNNCYHVTFFPR